MTRPAAGLTRLSGSFRFLLPSAGLAGRGLGAAFGIPPADEEAALVAAGAAAVVVVATATLADLVLPRPLEVASASLVLELPRVETSSKPPSVAASPSTSQWYPWALSRLGVALRARVALL